jgi:NAD(P)-dependent dehydrogenase (short-subunit alcohol dehydrogenase family)
MSDLEGKAALVTGASRGIGAAVARGLAQAGADVAITYLTAQDKADEVAAAIANLGRRPLVIQADSADPAAVQAAVQQTVTELGRLDILVNNAGLFPIGPLEQVTLQEAQRTLAVHALASFVAAQAAAAHMNEGGRIINIGSCFADRVPYPGLSLYAMSKAALVGLTKGLARDLGERGITVNVVHPGSTDTDMNPADAPEAEAEREYIALGRYAAPEEIAATAVALAGDAGRYVTGAAIAVDGGFSA